MREQGMSLRTIADKLGVSHMQVSRYLDDYSGVTPVTPDNQPTHDTEGLMPEEEEDEPIDPEFVKHLTRVAELAAKGMTQRKIAGRCLARDRWRGRTLG
jgi:transcriptional regulator with XRE-family HTH domain